MKKLILGLFFLVSSAQAMAGPGHHYQRPHYHNHWVAPLILGGVVGAVIMNQYQPPPPQVVYTMPPPPFGYRYIQIYDGYCNCFKWALTPNY